MEKASELVENSKSRTLLGRVIKGGFWVFLLRIVQQLFNLIRMAVLARILTPNDFGVMGIAMLTMSVLDTFSQTGFQQALIRKKEDILSYLNTAWTVLLLRGVILFVLLYLLAPYAAVFFKTPLATPIIRVIGLSILIQAFNNIGVVFFQKNLEFNKKFLYEFSSTLVDFIVSISAVLILKNIWAMALGLLAGNITRCIGSYFMHSYRPHLSINWKKLRELSIFGKWIFSSNILLFLATHIDSILVGKLLGMIPLGYYQLAYRISNMTTTEITHVISQVSFPAYSMMQDDYVRLKKNYLKVLRLTAYLTFPIAGIIFSAGPVFVELFFGKKWLPMVPAMTILAIAGVARAVMATTGYIFYAIGKPHILTEWQMIRFVILACILYPLAKMFNIIGVSWAVLISAVISTLGFCYNVVSEIQCTKKDFLDTLILPTINMVAIAASITIINNLVIISLGYKFFLYIITGLLITSLVSVLPWKRSGQDPFFSLEKIVGVLKKTFCDKENA